MPSRRAALLLGALPVLAAPIGRALGQDAAWPVRPVRLILPDAPGNGNDTIARLIAPALQAALGQPFVIENRAGAGGRIGVEAAFNAGPDGYAFLFGNAGSNGINAAIYPDLPYDLATAFEPVSLLVQGPNVLVVNRRALPVANVAGLVAALRARPGALNYASAGIGSSAHMSMELFKAAAGLQLVHVPYRGAPAMAQSLIAGETAAMFANLVNVMPFLQRGELTALAVTSQARWPGLPEVPTVADTYPGFETLAWNGILAPRGTPAPIRARLHAALVALRADSALEERVRGLGGALVASTPEAFAARIVADIAQWKGLVARTGIRVE
jgi:tripartite-type tricarboxylate transporter receptor subunit TctC